MGAQQRLGNAAVQEMMRASDPSEAPDRSVQQASSTPARAMPFRMDLEKAFGADLSPIRVHSGDEVTRSALQALGANAACIGDDLLLAESNPDKELVAHEVAHWVQAQAGSAPAGSASKPGDAAERDAEQAAKAAVAGAPVNVNTSATGEIQGDWFSNPMEALSNAVGWVSDEVGQAADAGAAAWSGVVDTASSAWQATEEVASSAWQATQDTASAAWQATEQTVSSAWQATEDAASSAWNATEQTASSAWQATENAAAFVAQETVVGATAAVEWCETGAAKAGEVVCDTVEGLIGGTVELVHDVEEAVPELGRQVESGLEEIGLGGISYVTGLKGLLEGELFAQANQTVSPNASMEGGLTGEADSGVVTLFVNGMNMDESDRLAAAQLTANELGHPVTLVSNPSLGPVWDLLECAREKYYGEVLNANGDASASTQMVAQTTADLLLSGTDVNIYAYSQGSLETAGGLRLALDLVASELAKRDPPPADPQAAAVELINEHVTVQPVGGAANAANASMLSFQDEFTYDEDEGLLSNFGGDMMQSLQAPFQMSEAAIGYDYPTWFTGLRPGVYDDKDKVGNLTREGRTAGENSCVEPDDSFLGSVGDLWSDTTAAHDYDGYWDNRQDDLLAPERDGGTESEAQT